MDAELEPELPGNSKFLKRIVQLTPHGIGVKFPHVEEETGRQIEWLEKRFCVAQAT